MESGVLWPVRNRRGLVKDVLVSYILTAICLQSNVTSSSHEFASL